MRWEAGHGGTGGRLEGTGESVDVDVELFKRKGNVMRGGEGDEAARGRGRAGIGVGGGVVIKVGIGDGVDGVAFVARSGEGEGGRAGGKREVTL